MFIDKKQIPAHLYLSPDEIQRRVDAKREEIRLYLQAYGFDQLTMGLSGGVDSAVAAAIVAPVVGPENFQVAMLSYDDLNTESLMIAREIADTIGVPETNRHTIDITQQVDLAWHISKVKFPAGDLNVRKANFMARQRMIHLMDMCAVFRAILVGTENLTEECLAYYTIGGDQISGIEPIINLWKTQVFLFGEHLGLPESVLSRPPSAELWDGQTDEGEFGEGTYLQRDIVLSALLQLEKSVGEIVKEFNLPIELVEKIKADYQSAGGKRNAPYIVQA